MRTHKRVWLCRWAHTGQACYGYVFIIYAAAVQNSLTRMNMHTWHPQPATHNLQPVNCTLPKLPKLQGAETFGGVHLIITKGLNA